MGVFDKRSTIDVQWTRRGADRYDSNVDGWYSVRAYVLAAKLCLPRMQNELMDLYQEHCLDRPPTLWTYEHMYNLLLVGCGMRRHLTVHMARYHRGAVFYKDWDVEEVHSVLPAVPELHLEVLRLLRYYKEQIIVTLDGFGTGFHEDSDD